VSNYQGNREYYCFQCRGLGRRVNAQHPNRQSGVLCVELITTAQRSQSSGESQEVVDVELACDCAIRRGPRLRGIEVRIMILVDEPEDHFGDDLSAGRPQLRTGCCKFTFLKNTIP
jgi:hypothetical protein